MKCGMYGIAEAGHVLEPGGNAESEGDDKARREDGSRERLYTWIGIKG